jgi:cell wall-active antibiotic response 4TMS protein YvqF
MPAWASGRCGSTVDDPGLRRSSLVAGVFFIAAGVVFLLERLGVWDVSLRVLGPVLLITLGVAIVVGGRAERPSP